MWSLLTKARYLNAATGTDIRDIFKRRVNDAVPQRRPYLRRDLNSLIDVDEDKIIGLLRLDRTDLINSTPVGYIRQEEVPRFTSSQFVRGMIWPISEPPADSSIRFGQME